MTPFTAPRRRLRLRRLAAVRVMLRPRATARLLGVLADQADMNRAAVGAVLRACAHAHVPR